MYIYPTSRGHTICAFLRRRSIEKCPEHLHLTPCNNPINTTGLHQSSTINPMAPTTVGRFQLYPPVSKRYRTSRIKRVLSPPAPLIHSFTSDPTFRAGNVWLSAPSLPTNGFP